MCIYIYTPGGFIAIKYIAMISYDMIYQLHIVMKLNDTFPALVKFTIIFRLDSLVLQRRNVRRNMIVPIALDVNVDWLWDQWMTPNEQHWIYGKMLGERREGSKRTRFFFFREIWNDDSNNKLDCSNLLSILMQSNKSNEWFYLPHASLWMSLDHLNPRNSYFQGPPNQSLLFHLPKMAKAMPVPRKSGLTRLSQQGKKKKNKPSSRARSISCIRQFRPMNLCLIQIWSNEKSFRSRVKLGQPAA